MKTKVLIISVSLAGAILYFSGSAFAAERPLWSNKCASCHDGKTALAAEPLAEKYKTVEDFTKAVQTKGHKAMNFFKNSIPLIKEIAKELEIKESKGK